MFPVCATVKKCYTPGIEEILCYAVEIGYTAGMETNTAHMTANETPLIRILVIDDDARLRESLREFFVPHGYTVSGLADGRNVESELARLAPDVVLLDVMIPGDDGFSILRRLRAVSRVSVIMLSARGEPIDRILGLEQGADDYIAKPFDPRELLARIKAVLRRMRADREGGHDAELFKGELSTGSITLDRDRQTLRRHDREKMLSTAEFAVIQVFMRHAGKVLSREEILTLAFGSDYYVNDRSIDVHINRLRKLLRDLGDEGMRIRTVWGKGYCWVPEG